jgi:GTP:adenosylcobinamide-phosphate guanylyltransferase
MHALILAGGEASPELLAVARGTGGSDSGTALDRALIELNGEPMIAPVIRALRAVPRIEQIAVVGSDAVLAAARRIDPAIVPVAAGARMVDNLAAGVAALGKSGQILACSCDIPLADATAFSELIEGARSRDLELAYPIVQRENCEAQFPGGKRTFARVSEGEFTGGNAFLIPARLIDHIIELTNTAYEARKRPHRLARLLGAGLLLKFLTKRLAIADVEARAAQVLRCRVGAIRMQHASIAFDVDKPEDLEVARRQFTSSGA